METNLKICKRLSPELDSSTCKPRQLELFKTSRPVCITFGNSKFSFIDLFAGIGGFRIPLEDLGGQCLGYSEIDKNALEVYQQNFISYVNNNEAYLGDITTME
jgi:DNA (cytosine-5)-methyltransferase 1